MADPTTGLSTFKSALKYGGARPSLFEFTVTAAPDGVALTLNSNKLGRAPPYSRADVKDVSPVV